MMEADVVLAEAPAMRRQLITHVTPETVNRAMADEYSVPSRERLGMTPRRREVLTPEKHAAWWRYGVRVWGWSS